VSHKFAVSIAVLSSIAATQAATTPVAATPAPPKPVHVRLAYIGGPDNPVLIGFTTDRPLRTQANGTIQGRAGVLNSPTSLGHLSNPSKRCYRAFGSSLVIKRLKVGNRYEVKIDLGPDNAQKTFIRKLTLRRAKPATVRRQLGC